MNESDSPDVFADLVTDDEELQGFLSRLREQVPAVVFQLYTAEGRFLPPDSSPACPTGNLEIYRKLSENGGIIRIEGAENLYGLAVPQLEVLLLFELKDFGWDVAASPTLTGLIQACIDLALVKHESEILELENQQIQRQIQVLNKQHHKLVEDNYRQYCLIQEREKGYARELESEISRKTAKLKEANVRLEESSRLKSEFLANMSHELRTPLNAILGFTDLLAETELQGEQLEFSNTIRSAGNTLLVLINDILDLAKIEAGRIDLEKVPFGLAMVVSMVEKLFRKQAREKGVRLVSYLDERLPPQLLGDATRLQQILLNLVGNAVKFTSIGTVELRAELAGKREKEILVRFTVKDSGIGIPVERQQAIFEKFTQADGSTTRKYGGTGLGLAISSQLVELMGGEILLESVPGEGSTFMINLPFAMMAAVANTGASAISAGPGNQGARPAPLSAAPVVLLVEDNLVNQRLAGILVRKQNCEVIVASDGVEALEALKSHSCDLILMDFQMPRLDGLATTRKIREFEKGRDKEEYVGLREKTAPIPIVGLTAHARKEDEQASREAGMDGFLAKPINREKLAAALEKFLFGS